MQTVITRKISTRSSKRKGFTLIELLVVIAIIALLAAILFPVFARARENARRASCASNMKQIGLGIIQYEQDYDELLPCAVGYGTGTTWRTSIFPYVKSSQIFNCPSRSTSAADSNGGTDPGQGITTALSSHYAANGIADPSTAAYPAGGSQASCGASTTNGALRIAGGVAVNYPAGPISSYFSFAPYNPLKISAIISPSQLIGVVEQLYPSNGSPAELAAAYQVVSPTDIRGLWAGHLGTSNYLFLDGHVKAMKPVATAVPYDLWDVNRQDQPCQRIVDGTNSGGAPNGVGPVQTMY